MYLMLVSRPDIAYAVNQVSQFCESPASLHWEAVKRILAYLQGTSTFGTRFGGVKSDLIGFSDSDYAGDVDTRQSTSGFVPFPGAAKDSHVWHCPPQRRSSLLPVRPQRKEFGFND